MKTYIYILMASYKNDPEYKQIIGVYKDYDIAKEAQENLSWDQSLYSLYIIREELRG